MKTIELSKATQPLAAYASRIKSGPVLVTRRGRPVAAVISMEGMDAESLSLSTNPKFVGIIERSRASHKEKGGIPLEEVRRRLGLTKTGTRKRSAG